LPPKLFNVCDTPMAFYFQRQTQTVNEFYAGEFWRYYYDKFLIPGCERFIDLTSSNSRDEVMSVLEGSDIFLFHASRNYRRPLVCRDGLIKSSEYPKGKTEIVLIHGQPETLEVKRTNEFIDEHKKKLRFFVATPNQTNLFKNVELFPIVGQFTTKNEIYQPRKDFLKKDGEVRVIRRNEWKASVIAISTLDQMGLKKEMISSGVRNKCFFLMHVLVGMKTGLQIPQKKFFREKNGQTISFDNRTHWQDLYTVLEDLRAADIILENDWKDYPGGGCNHTIGIEAMSMGVACFNAMTKTNSMKLADWLGADRLPPLPNWDDEAHYRKDCERYLHRMFFDGDFRLNLKKQSRQFFVDWYDAPNIVPKLIKQLRAK